MANTLRLIFRTFVLIFCIVAACRSKNNDGEMLLQKCMRTQGFGGKDFEDLTPAQKGQVLGCMNIKHENLHKAYKDIGKHAKRLACKSNLRYAIDMFIKKLLLVPEDGFSRQGKYLKMFYHAVETRRIKLSNILKIFQGIIAYSQENEAQWIKNFEDGMKLIRELSISKSSFACVTTMETETPTLNAGIALGQLSKTATMDEAKKVYWEEQATFWKELVQSQNEVIDILEELSMELPESEVIKIVEPVERFTEKKYFHGAARVKKIFKEKVTDRYLKCCWSMYTSSNERKARIDNDLEKQWPEHQYESRVDLLCSGISTLFQIMSDADFHAPETARLPKEFQPEPQDYIEYVNSIAAEKGNNELVGVALILKNVYPSSSTPTSDTPD